MSLVTKEKRALLRAYDAKGREVASLSGTRMRFTAISSMSQTPNTLQASVYGIDARDYGVIEGRAKTVKLYAGNNLQSGLIAEGQVVFSKLESTTEGTSLDVTALDGDDFYAMPVNRAIAAGISLAGVVEELVGMTGGLTGIGQISPRAREITLPRGVSIIGSPIQVIRNVAKKINAAFYVNQGLVYIVCEDEMVGKPVQLEDENLLGIPVRSGFEIRALHDINSGIRVGNSVVMPGGGMYRVQRILTEGDTMNPAWRMTIEGAEQNETGFAQSAVSSNVWR